MGKWFVELLEFVGSSLETVDRELIAGPFDSIEECEAECVKLTRNAIGGVIEEVSDKCYTDTRSRNLFRLSPETEWGHDNSVKRDRFNSSAKALATWAKKTGQAYCGFDDTWITDILGEGN